MSKPVDKDPRFWNGQKVNPWGDPGQEAILKRFFGRTLMEVWRSPSKEEFAIFFQDGSWMYFYADAGCCSWSWIEHIVEPKGLNGATLLPMTQEQLEQFDYPEPYSEVEVETKDEDQWSHTSTVKSYVTTFHTSAGYLDVEFRNSSNGYYSGSLRLSHYYDSQEPKRN